jgi:glycosyltransferase involved in cell wall biosynthesis
MCIYPPLLDGSAYTNSEFAMGLAKNGYDVEVIAQPCEGHVNYDRWSEETLGIKVHRIPTGYVYEAEPPTQEHLDTVSNFIRDLLTGRNGTMPGVGIIGHDSYAWYETVLHDFDLPVVQYLMGTPTRGLNDGIYPDREKNQFISHIKNADHIITIADHFKDLVVSFGVPPEQVTTIRNGIDLSYFHPRIPDKRLQYG